VVYRKPHRAAAIWAALLLVMLFVNLFRGV